MHSEYSILALSLVAGLLSLAGFLPVDFDWESLPESDDYEIDLEESLESRTAIHANRGAAATSAT